MNSDYRLLGACLCIALGSALSAPAWADDNESTRSGADGNTGSLEAKARSFDADAAGRGQARVQQRIVSDFAGWAGSGENAGALVTGLRSGTSIRLYGAGGESVSFQPGTRPMGYGNVYISLALARARLVAQGITEPTPLQLQTALTGITLASGSPPQSLQSRGVLQLRSDGMGWGRIAQVYDLKLGPVMADMHSAHHSLVSTGAPAMAGPVRASGIVTASGTAPAMNGYGTGHGKAHPVGVSASVSGAAHASPPIRPMTGIVTAAGAADAGRAQGLAKGRFK